MSLSTRCIVFWLFFRFIAYQIIVGIQDTLTLQFPILLQRDDNPWELISTAIEKRHIYIAHRLSFRFACRLVISLATVCKPSLFSIQRASSSSLDGFGEGMQVAETKTDILDKLIYYIAHLWHVRYQLQDSVRTRTNQTGLHVMYRLPCPVRTFKICYQQAIQGPLFFSFSFAKNC